MNEQTQQLIDKLATKLGTTAEHLWGVLIKQAPISSTIDLIGIALLFAVLLYAYKLLKRADLDYADGPLAFALWWLFFLLGLIVSIIAMPYILSGFFNPEYWALKQLI